MDFLRDTFSREIENFGPLADFFDLRSESELCLLADLSNLQDSFRLRALRRAHKIAEQMISDSGDFNEERWNQVFPTLEQRGFILFPGGENDRTFSVRQVELLKKLPKLFKQLKRFHKPLCHQGAERLIRDTMQLSPKSFLTDAHIRRAVLSGCLTLLRQNVGSCFATAPAILIQEEQVERLLTDFYEILTTGKLKRVISGLEFSVPLSPSWGWGDLRKKIDSGHLEYCPGFLQALIAIGILDPQTRLEKKVTKARALISPFIGRGFMVEEILRALLIGHFGAKMEEKEREARSVFRAVTDHALLKAWEFTIASFSEAKMEFSRWNLYVSLGFDPKEKQGIGELLYHYAEEKLKESNEKVQRYQIEYENSFNQVKAVEALLRNVSSEEEGRRWRAEYQGRYYHMQSALDMRDRAYSAASHYSSLFAFMIKQYDEKFPEYFQEIYDPEMHEPVQNVQELYDDTPAGFRLVYKHGRADAYAWSFIYDEKQFVDALVDFFRMTEGLIAAAFEWEEGKRAIQEMTTAVILHVRTKEFLDSAVKRRDKPWAYIAGGSMMHLLKIYFRREGDLSEEERWVENEQELLIFFLETLKNLPPVAFEGAKRMLTFSPTHAFILEPFCDLFHKGWSDEGFTYTWVRDEVITPRMAYYEKLFLSSEQQRFLIEEFSQRLPPLAAHHFRRNLPLFDKSLLVREFRDQVMQTPHFDAFLYEMLPLFPGVEWKAAVRRLCDHPRLEAALDHFPDLPASWIGKRQLFDLAKASYLAAEGSCFLSFDLHEAIVKRAAKERLSPPPPLIFADTNWPNFFFAFLVNPGTLALELWRTDSTGTYGMPMTSWKPFINGKERKTWGLYTRPYQYR
jgi:hypothetical protein